MRRLVWAVGALAALGSPPAVAEDAPPSAAEIQQAIDRGTAWLRARFDDGLDGALWTDPVEVVMLTLAHTGGNRSDPAFAKGLAYLEKAEPRFTYRTALLAMALSEINPRQYQARIAHCAQWLVDTQLRDGEWGYPGSLQGKAVRPQEFRVSPPSTGSEKDPSAPRDRIVIERREAITSDQPMKGDFSNTQFAILGLRACREAKVEVPQATWKAALGYLRKFQRPDGGWGYVMAGEQDAVSYSSLTAAGVCSAAICLHATGTKDPKSDPLVKKGLAWLKKNPDVGTNVGIDESLVMGPSSYQCYHLYSVERAGRVLGVEEIGAGPWYAQGARWLLAAQKEDGRWEDDAGPGAGSRGRYLTVADTCFALLFLSRATRPLTGR